jgi:acyl carrier protein
MNTRERVRRFILDNFYVSDPTELTDDLSLIDSGLVDSTGMMDVILFIETEFGIHVEDRETIPENLESISRIADFVERRLEVGPSEAAERVGSG